MPKINIEFPEDSLFSTEIDVMVTDLVGGLHVGNHVLISYLTEAQMRFLSAIGFPDLTVEGMVNINTDISVNYMSEVHYGDKLVIDIALGDVEEKGYDLLFKITKQGSSKVVLLATMGMIFLDLEIHRVVDIPNSFISACVKAGKQ